MEDPAAIADFSIFPRSLSCSGIDGELLANVSVPEVETH